MIIQLGKTYYNTEANLNEEDFKATFKGKLDIDLELAWKIASKYYRELEKPKRRRSRK